MDTEFTRANARGSSKDAQDELSPGSLCGALPAGFDAGELLIHARERGVMYVPGRYFYHQNPQPNTLRLGFASLDERRIARGIEILGDVVKTEFRKRQRGARSELHSRVALV